MWTYTCLLFFLPRDDLKSGRRSEVPPTPPPWQVLFPFLFPSYYFFCLSSTSGPPFSSPSINLVPPKLGCRSPPFRSSFVKFPFFVAEHFFSDVTRRTFAKFSSSPHSRLKTAFPPCYTLFVGSGRLSPFNHSHLPARFFLFRLPLGNRGTRPTPIPSGLLVVSLSIVCGRSFLSSHPPLPSILKKKPVFFPSRLPIPAISWSPSWLRTSRFPFWLPKR